MARSSWRRAARRSAGALGRGAGGQRQPAGPRGDRRRVQGHGDRRRSGACCRRRAADGQLSVHGRRARRPALRRGRRAARRRRARPPDRAALRPDRQPPRPLPRRARRSAGRHLADRRPRSTEPTGAHEDDRPRRRRDRHVDRLLSRQARPRGGPDRAPGGRGAGDQLRQRRRAAYQRGRALVAPRHAAPVLEVAGPGRRPDAPPLQRAAQDVALGARLRPQLHAGAVPSPHRQINLRLSSSILCSASRKSERRPASTTI